MTGFLHVLIGLTTFEDLSELRGFPEQPHSRVAAILQISADTHILYI